MFGRLHKFTFTHKYLYLKRIIMRNLLLIVAVAFVFLAGSCTQRTCPTYTKGIQELPQEQSDTQAGEEARI